MMQAEVVAQEGSRVTLQITVDIEGSLLQAEETILAACNALGCRATEEALRRLDTDGRPIVLGAEKWTAKCRDRKVYQSPYGPVEVERYRYQSSRGGKSYCPLEAAGRIIRGATPRFAKMITHKYADLNAPSVCSDLEANHQRRIAHSYVQNVAEAVGAIAAAKEESWHYATPKLAEAITTVAISLDGAHMRMKDEGWREAMVGSVSLYDVAGERRHTIYIGAAPEYGKGHFLQRLEREVAHVKGLYPQARYVGIADGAKTNWPFLQRHTEQQVLDFFHATEYLAKAAAAAHPETTAQAQRQCWLQERCHRLKHEPDGAATLLSEMQTLSRRRRLSAVGREQLQAAITYFENQGHLMNYAAHLKAGLPIGSGVTEAACKTLIKQRFCGAGMRWKEKGVKVVLSLRELVQTQGRWEQFWKKIDRYGAVVAC